MTSGTAIRIAVTHDLHDFDVTVTDRGNVSVPSFGLPECGPDLTSEIVDQEHFELCVAIVAHGFLATKAERKHDTRTCPGELMSILYNDFVDELMEIARQLVRLDKLKGDPRLYAAAVRKCIDDGVTPAACTELVLQTLTQEELSTYFAEC
jgi:hypothetical protein